MFFIPNTSVQWNLLPSFISCKDLQPVPLFCYLTTLYFCYVHHCFNVCITFFFLLLLQCLCHYHVEFCTEVQKMLVFFYDQLFPSFSQYSCVKLFGGSPCSPLFDMWERIVNFYIPHTRAYSCFSIFQFLFGIHIYFPINVKETFLFLFCVNGNRQLFIF